MLTIAALAVEIVLIDKLEIPWGFPTNDQVG